VAATIGSNEVSSNAAPTDQHRGKEDQTLHRDEGRPATNALAKATAARDDLCAGKVIGRIISFA
jgi:hypothetical protein